MLLSRRHFLGWGGGLALTCLMPCPVWGRVLKNSAPKMLWLYNTHTGEMIKEPYWHRGAYIQSGIGKLNYVLRDHRSNEIKTIHLGVLELLFQMQQLLGYRKPFDIISGYRSLHTNAQLRKRGRKGVAKNSFHTKGMAVDVHFRGLSLMRAQKAACFLRKGGVGFYPSDGFIHMDVRGKLVRWHG